MSELARVAEGAGHDAEALRRRIRELWGCEITIEYAQALLAFIEQMTRRVADLEERLRKGGCDALDNPQE